MKQIADQDSEHRILSAMLNAQSDNPFITILNTLDSSDFSDPFAHALFDLIDNLYRTGTSRPTTIEVMKEGMRLGFLEGKKDFDKLQEISKKYIDDENVEYWAGKVKEASKGRKAQILLAKYVNEIQKPKTDISSLISEMGGEFFNLSLQSAVSKIDTGQDLADLGCEVIDRKVKNYRDNIETAKLLGTIPLDGVPTGMPDLDRLTLGYKGGDLILLGAQTGIGKTAFAMNTANAACISNPNKDPLFYINTEMSREQIALRFGSILAGSPMQQSRSGSLTDEQVKQIKEAYQTKLATSGFYAAHEPNLTPRRLEEITRKMVMQHGIKMMILDYVGRLDKIDPKGKLQEWQMLEQVVKSLKQLAQNLNIAVMALIQLNPGDTIQGAQRMKNEADIFMKFQLVDTEEKVREIEKYRKKRYEEFNSFIFLEKSRDSAAGISIPIVFDKGRQQMRQANVIKEFVPANWSADGKEVRR